MCTILNNGYFSAPVQLERGLRQGWPLSLSLYVIQGEVNTKNINQEENIKGMKIPNKIEVKISQYVDDSNFYLTKQDSVKNVLNFFETLKKATGPTINLDKTKILPINTSQTLYLQQNLPNITMKE